MNDFYKLYGSGSDEVGKMIEEVSKHNFYFGHQSVGYNILDGIDQWEKETEKSLNIIESRDFSGKPLPTFVHYTFGQNGDPKGKIDDFFSQLEQIPEENNGIVFFKLCYVDITQPPDIDEIFSYYKEKMLSAKADHSNLRIILFTAPVTGIQKGLKATAKKLLNRQPYGVLENTKREEFNEKIRNELSSEFPVFDLARIESTLPDGSANTYTYEGKSYPYMPTNYTSDLGHLNDFGARIVAYNLIAFLSEIINA